MIQAIPEVKDFKWVYVMRHFDVHLAGICKVNGETLFARLESEERSKSQLKYRVYRFGQSEAAYFLKRQAEFERQVGTHWTYDEEGRRGPAYVPKPQHAGPNGIPLFYSMPKEFDFDEVANRSECVGIYLVPNSED